MPRKVAIVGAARKCSIFVHPHPIICTGARVKLKNRFQHALHIVGCAAALTLSDAGDAGPDPSGVSFGCAAVLTLSDAGDAGPDPPGLSVGCASALATGFGLSVSSPEDAALCRSWKRLDRPYIVLEDEGEDEDEDEAEDEDEDEAEDEDEDPVEPL